MNSEEMKKIAVIALLGALVFTWVFSLTNYLKREPLSGLIDDQTQLFRGYDALVAMEVNFTVAGNWDMGGTINENDTVMWVEANSYELKAGDIIFYRSPTSGENLAHRVVEAVGGSFRTKGDGAAENDNYLVGGELHGIVIGVAYYRA